jgi:hypothetical protein
LQKPQSFGHPETTWRFRNQDPANSRRTRRLIRGIRIHEQSHVTTQRGKRGCLIATIFHDATLGTRIEN